METNQESKLREEILGDARVKAERAWARARNEADALRRKCRREIAAHRTARLNEVSAAAREESNHLLLQVEQQTRALWLKRREESLDDLFAKAVAECAKLTGEQRERSLAALTEEALRGLGSLPRLTARFPSDCADFLTVGWLRKCAERALGADGAAMEFDLDPHGEPGIVLSTPDGRMCFDNTYRSRLRYLKEELRTMVL